MLNDVQTIVIVGAPGGTFQLGLDELVTDPIPCGSAPSVVQAAIGGQCTVEYGTVAAYLVTTAPDKFFTILPKNDFGEPSMHIHNYLPEYTTSMANQPESAIYVEHVQEGDDETDDIQTLVTTDNEGLFTLIVKHDDDDATYEHTSAITRNCGAEAVEAALGYLPFLYERCDFTVASVEAVSYRVTFPNMVALPRLTAIPDFTGGTFPFMTVIHTVVGGPIIPDCCFSWTPVSSTSTDGRRVVIQRLTR